MFADLDMAQPKSIMSWGFHHDWHVNPSEEVWCVYDI